MSDDEKKSLNRKLAILVIGGAAIMIFVLAICLSSLFERDTANAGTGTKFFGLFSDAEVKPLPVITKEDRDAEYESRDPFTQDTVDGFDETVMSLLSEGKFDDADAYLRDLEDTYKDVGEDEGLSLSYTAMTDMYRSDIASVKAMTTAGPDNSGNLMRHFMTSEVLAAAVAYAPISLKLDSFLNEDSVCLPGIFAEDAGNTNLTKIPLTPAEYKPIIDDINLRRSEEDKVIGVDVYEFEAYGIPCKLQIVTQSDFTCAPYKLTVEPGYLADDYYKVSSLKELRALNADNDWFDIDSASYLGSPSSQDEE